MKSFVPTWLISCLGCGLAVVCLDPTRSHFMQASCALRGVESTQRPRFGAQLMVESSTLGVIPTTPLPQTIGDFPLHTVRDADHVVIMCHSSHSAIVYHFLLPFPHVQPHCHPFSVHQCLRRCFCATSSDARTLHSNLINNTFTYRCPPAHLICRRNATCREFMMMCAF